MERNEHLGCCGDHTEVTREGIVTEYEYDTLGRPYQQTRLGVSGAPRSAGRRRSDDV